MAISPRPSRAVATRWVRVRRPFVLGLFFVAWEWTGGWPSAAAEPGPRAHAQAKAGGGPRLSAKNEARSDPLVAERADRPGSLPAIFEGPVVDAELHRVRRAAQKSILGSRCPPGRQALAYAAGGREPPRTLAAARALAAGGDDLTPPSLGRFVPVEGEATLEHFHQALTRLAAGGDPDGKVRILAYGASHTQADVYTGYLREYLQRRFGDGGQGFVLLGRVNDWYRTLDTKVRHQRLTAIHARYRLDVANEPLGLLGAAFVASDASAFAELVTAKDSKDTRYELHYYAQPGGGSFSLSIDGKRIAEVATQSDAAGPRYLAFEAAPGRRVIRAKLKGDGPVRWFGLTAESAAPGIVIDTLGIAGSRMNGNLSWDEATWADAVRRRNPDLVTFAYGTNEATDEGLSSEVYENEVRAVLWRLRRAAPLASCVLVAPFDVAVHLRARLGRLAEIQRRIAGDYGCGFWDGNAFMGGAGSIERWSAVGPPLATIDHIHLTRLGYVYAGIALGDALMRAWDLALTYSPDVARVSLVPAPSGAL